MKELEKRFSREVDQHQHELSTLQDVHRQTISSLQKKNKDAIDQHKCQMAATSDQKPSQGSREVESLVEKLEHLERVNAKLQYDLEHTHAADIRKAQHIDALSYQLNEAKTEITRVCWHVITVL